VAERGRPTAELVLTDEERSTLTRWTRRRKSAQALALRSRIVLGCAEGLSNKAVAARERVSQPTVGKWRRRFVEARCDGGIVKLFENYCGAVDVSLFGVQICWHTRSADQDPRTLNAPALARAAAKSSRSGSPLVPRSAGSGRPGRSSHPVVRGRCGRPDSPGSTPDGRAPVAPRSAGSGFRGARCPTSATAAAARARVSTVSMLMESVTSWDAGGFEVGVSCHGVPIPAGLDPFHPGSGPVRHVTLFENTCGAVDVSGLGCGPY
jgi:Homeodomain-like domain